jgi:hypothetical protein
MVVSADGRVVALLLLVQLIVPFQHAGIFAGPSWRIAQVGPQKRATGSISRLVEALTPRGIALNGP